MSSGSVHQHQQREAIAAGNPLMPHLVLAKGLPAMIYGYVSQFLQRCTEEVETGGMFIGEVAGAGEVPVLRLRGFIGAGPNAECQPESVLFDSDYQSRMLHLMRLRYPRATNLGCIHVHPEQMDVCSEKDWLADVEAVRASDTKALVFAIITTNNPGSDALSLYYRDCKFDFYILGEQSGFEYLHVRPAVQAIALFQPASAQLSLQESVNTGVPPRRHYAYRPKVLQDKRRLVAEVRAMEERFGGRATLRLEGDRLYWEYTVQQSGRRFPIQVCYPRRYPLEPPRILSVLPLPGSPHQLPGNELCWTNRSGPCDWNPARDTAATCILAAHRWFACLLVYLTLGTWPAQADDTR